MAIGNNSQKTKEDFEEKEPRDPLKEIAKAICKKYILDVLQRPPRCFTEACLNEYFEKDDRCKDCYEKVFQNNKKLIKSWWSELLFDYADMKKAYILVKKVLNEYSSLKDFREKSKKNEAFWDYVDYTKEHDIFSSDYKEGSVVKKRSVYILYDKNNKEIIRTYYLAEIRKAITKLVPRGASKASSDKLLEDFLLGKKNENIPYSIKVEIEKK